MVLMNTWMGPVFALAMESVSARCRGLTNAVFQAAANLIGVGLGPVVAGALSDYYGGPTSLRPAIATLFLLNIATVAALLVGMRMISRLGRAGVR
jgi:MFS family permease